MCSLYSYTRGALFTISIYIYLLSYFCIKRRKRTLNLVVVDGFQRTHFFYNNKISVYVCKDCFLRKHLLSNIPYILRQPMKTILVLLSVTPPFDLQNTYIRCWILFHLDLSRYFSDVNL